MPVNLLRLLLTCALFAVVRLASGQTDLAVHVQVDKLFSTANTPYQAVILLTNEGTELATGLSVELRLSPSLFFLNGQTTTGIFSAATLNWKLERLAAGATDTLRLAVQPNGGGIHTVGAELMKASGQDWDSTPANKAVREDDQDEACFTVPISLSCGQHAVLRAPFGKTGYAWFRNDTLLSYALSDTLHPGRSGDYRYTITGETCLSGACCPVRIDRAGCSHDLALVATATPLDQTSQFQRVTLKLFNEGAGPVSRVSLYVTVSRFMRLSTNIAQTGWQLGGDKMRKDWLGVLEPGDSATVSFDIQSIAGGAASDYVMFTEIAKFYSGTTLLTDADSSPDEDPSNDKVVRNGRHLASTIDEDDSDIVSLTNCPSFSVAGNEPVCQGNALKLRVIPASNVSGVISYRWSGDATFSCKDCATPSITIAHDTNVEVEVVTGEGCVFRESVTLKTKDCSTETLLVVSPYAKSEQCISVPSAARPNWCVSTLPQGITMSDRRPSSTQLCVVGASTGQWAGVAEPCFEICVGTSCTPTKIRVLGLPKRDEVTIGNDGRTCVDAYLQVRTPALRYSVQDEGTGVTLVGDGRCFSLKGEPAVHPGTKFSIIHEYQLLGRTVFDTTVVAVPAKLGCTLDVFTDATYESSLDPGATVANGSTFLCLSGTLQTLGSLSYTLDGKPIPAPTAGCDPLAVAKFSLRGLAKGYTDNGWRIERYVVGGATVITNKTFLDLAAVAAAIRGVDPTSVVTVEPGLQVLEVSGFQKKPERLVLRHLATSSGIDVQPIIINGFRGWRLIVPAGTTAGEYALTATDPQGCQDFGRVKVSVATSALVVRDTIRIRGEVGEPIYVSQLSGFKRIDGAGWSPLSEGYVITIDRAGIVSSLFVDATASPRRERLVLTEVTERSCLPLAPNRDILVTPANCVAQTVPLGLTRPGMTAFTSAGSVLNLSVPTGKRAGAAYPLADLEYNGLTTIYTITSWPGLPTAAGVDGNLPQILRELRRLGIDAHADWSAGMVYVANAGTEAVKLKIAGGGSLTWKPSATQLDTYGALYNRPGTARVSVSIANCMVDLSVLVKCATRPTIPGGSFTVLAGASVDLPRVELGAGAGASITIAEVETGIWGELDPNGGLLTVRTDANSQGNYKLVVEICETEGDCQLVEHTIRVGQVPCTVNIWRDESEHLVVGAGDPGGILFLPASFNATTDKILVDGVVAGAALSNRMLGVERVYNLPRGASQIQTPFGKTFDITGGDLRKALAQVFAEAEILREGTEVRLRGVDREATLYVGDVNGIWAPLEPVMIRDETRAVLTLLPGNHLVELVRGSDAEAPGCRDAITVKVARAPTTIVKEQLALLAGEIETYCLPTARANAAVLAIVNDCLGASGERASATVSGACVNVEAFEAGKERVCLRRLYLDGGVDSILLEINVEAAFVLSARPDRDSIDFGHFKVIEVLRNDVISDEPRSLSLVSEPFFGRAQVVGNSAIEYLHYGSDCAKDVFTYEICQGDACETATVELEVFCDELLIYNGLSPNGDGVNEEFTILGLGQYPKHEISIFNREGNVLAVFRDYTNDWRGTIDGAPLAEGTYFYVIDLGNGETRSGYLQLSR